MKNLIYVFWAVVLVAVVMLLLSISDNNWPGSILVGVMIVGLAVAGVQFWSKNLAKKKELRGKPVPKDFDEFDDLVWDLSCQDWYLEKICKKEDLEDMAKLYRDKIRAVWNDSYENPQEQIEEARGYTHRLQTLLWCIKQK